MFVDRVNHILIRVGGGRQARHEEDLLRKEGVHIISHELLIDEDARSRWGERENSIFSDTTSA